MTIFVIIPTGVEEPVAASIRAAMPKNHRLPRGEWLVSFTGTSKELSDTLKVTTGEGGNAVILSVSGYFGRAPTDVWEWIKGNWSA